MNSIRWSVLAVLVPLFAAFALPQQINYQGSLARPDGSPLDTTVAITFKLYADSTFGSQLWAETHPAVNVVGGSFQVHMGAVTPITDAVINQPQVWLGITVGNDTEMAPRTQLVSVPYAYRVATIDGAVGGTVSGDVTVVGKGNIAVNSTNLGQYAFVAGAANHADDQYSSISGGIQNHTGGTHSHVGGGGQNTAGDSGGGSYQTVGGGGLNFAGGQGSTVSGGISDSAKGASSTISGGLNNLANGLYSFIGGGFSNTASDSAATIGGGSGNLVTGLYSTIGGGLGNILIGDLSVIGGGFQDTLSGFRSVIAGGYRNVASAAATTIGGGDNNYASGGLATIAGGSANRAGLNATIGGGFSNWALGSNATIAGGGINRALGAASFIGGGQDNVADTTYGTVCGGQGNMTHGRYAAIVSGGGPYAADSNSATGDYSFIANGKQNRATGAYSVVLGGHNNVTNGENSFAAGQGAVANSPGSFVWGSSSTGHATNSIGSYSVVFRCQGGAAFYTDSSHTNIGVAVAPGSGTWLSISDSTAKRRYGRVDTRGILEKITQLPIERWSYKTQSEKIQHIGPMAQDFYQAFGVGDNNTTMSGVDPDGIALAAIQELAKENQELRQQLNELRAQVQSVAASSQKTLKEK